MTDPTHPVLTGRPVLDLVPVTVPDCDLVLLDDRGDLIALDLDTGEQRVLCRVPLPVLRQRSNELHLTSERVRLLVSADTTVAVVVRDGGRDGVVVDLGTGAVTLRLSNDGYHCGTVRFSAALVRHGARWAVVHRTAWNRLDVSDALTGELLTPRTGTDDLDYFHAGLAVSRSGRFIADGGWVWSPDGDLRVWSLADWLDRNPDESENGPSVVTPMITEDWDAPMVWLTGDLLVVACPDTWEAEQDERPVAPHLRVIDPTAPAWDRRLDVGALPTALLTDGRLVIGTSGDASTAWDPGTGDRVWHWPDFAPDAIDVPGGRAVRVEGSTVVVRRLP